MRTKYVVLALLIVLLSYGAANAAVFQWGEGDLFQQLKTVFGTTSDGHNHDGTNSRQEGTSTTNPTFATSVIATGHKAGVTIVVSTISHLTSASLAYGYLRRTQDSPANITVDLEEGVPGQMVTIQLTAKAAGNYIISKTCTATPVTTTGWSLLTFDTALDQITLLYMDSTTGWIVVSNAGVTITP